MTKFAWMCSTEAFQPEVLLDQVTQAEEAGFDAIVVPDAFHPWTDEGAGGFTWSWLGAAAERTERIELITTVTAPFFRYHPTVIAQASATMDRLSRGRFVLGIGTGHPLHDSSLGWPDVSYADRVSHLREAAQIIRLLLSGEPVDFAGLHYRLDGVRLYSPPTHGVRMWMAAAGPRSAALAGELADGVITSVKDIEEARRKVVEPYLSGCENGSRPTLVATRWVIVGADDDGSWRALGPLRGLRVPARDVLTHPEQMRIEADRTGPAGILPRFMRARSLEEVGALYEPLVRDLGADYVSVQLATSDPVGALDFVGRQVLPELRASASPG